MSGNSTKISCVCEICGKEKLFPQCWVNRGGGKYCSRECANKGLASRPLFLRFSGKISEPTSTGCLLWQGKINKNRHGRFTFQGKEISVHRAVYQDRYGNIPTDQRILHTCGNPYCVNIEHLYPEKPAEYKCEYCSAVCFTTQSKAKRGVRFCSAKCAYIGMKRTAEARFMEKVGVPDERGCTPWIGAKEAAGYGIFTLDGNRSQRRDGEGCQTIKAHRMAYRLAFGDFDESLCVCHMCDNPTCVNPSHLFLGTYMDNNQDKEKKGRGNHVRGSRIGKAKLTEFQIIEIRMLHASGQTCKEIAKQYGVGKSAISYAVNGDTWAHVK